MVLLNSEQPESARCRGIAEDIRRRYQVSCLCVNCQEISREELDDVMKQLLCEFPLQELQLFLPPWVSALSADHPIKAGIFRAVKESACHMNHIRDLDAYLEQLSSQEWMSGVASRGIDLGTGCASADLKVPRRLFYETVSQQSGITVEDDGDLMVQLTKLADIKKEYDRIGPALQMAMETGYGIVMPDSQELNLEDPEIVRQGGRFGLRMKASAPSVHMIRADIETTVSPIVGNEKQSEDMVNYLLQEFEGDTSKIWQSNLFGRSFHEIVNDDLQGKIARMPVESRKKLREALERIINEGSGGLICIIL